METTTTLLGASELRRMAHRYWMVGLSLSVTVHLTLLTVIILAQPGEGTGGGGIRVSFMPRSPDQTTIAGIIPLRPAPGGITRLPVHDGTPVPVDYLPPDSTLPTQEARASGVDPLGDPGGGEGGGEIVIPPDPEAEPEPFVPVERDPVLIRGSVPEYPPLASSLGLEGRVWVKIWVDAEGRARKAVVLKSTAEVFEASALKAAMEFLFTPAIMDGKPVSVWVSIPFQFRLKG
jgi:TonB family protein